MPAYLIANITVTDPEAFKAYGAKVPAVIAQFGGRYLVRGGAVTAVEGASPFNRLVVLEFPSMDAARGFYNSPEYLAAREARAGVSDFDMLLVEAY